jgi:hypothetical protein
MTSLSTSKTAVGVIRGIQRSQHRLTTEPINKGAGPDVLPARNLHSVEPVVYVVESYQQIEERKRDGDAA